MILISLDAIWKNCEGRSCQAARLATARGIELLTTGGTGVHGGFLSNLRELL